MRRVNIHLAEDMDRAAEREAHRRGISKAELIRRGIARELEAAYDTSASWDSFLAADDDEPVDELDAAIYEDGR